MKALEISEPIKHHIQTAMNGDAQSFGAAFQWFRPYLYLHALRVCGNSGNAQDALQDTFISAFTNIHTLRQHASFYPWLKKILLNHCHLLLRKEKSLHRLQRFAGTDSDIYDSIHLQFDQSSNQQVLYSLISRLSGELQSCLILRYFSSFNSYEEIAVILGIPVGTVRSRLSAAREKLSSLYRIHQDAGNKAMNRSKEWSDYYRYSMENLYKDTSIRNQFFRHFNPSLKVRFTSGKMATGSSIVENEILDDLNHGSKLNISDINSCENLSVVEGFNVNSSEFPGRCASTTVLVFFRTNNLVSHLHIFDSARDTVR
ncbi:MAG: RNA polymerase sigma factor [Sphingobacteriales bacterium]|nr:MAG: RNA polymerase sigma factor [Sphingobacteriales bacterium]